MTKIYKFTNFQAVSKIDVRGQFRITVYQQTNNNKQQENVIAKFFRRTHPIASTFTGDHLPENTLQKCHITWNYRRNANNFTKCMEIWNHMSARAHHVYKNVG